MSLKSDMEVLAKMTRRIDTSVLNPDEPAWTCEKDDELPALEGTEEHTGGSSSYYTVAIDNPQEECKQPYEAECIDVMRALGMNVDEVNAFKAIWRTAAARTLLKTKKGNNELYDAEKVLFAAQNMVRAYKRG